MNSAAYMNRFVKRRVFDKEVSDQDENDTYLAPEWEESDDTFTNRNTIRGQEEDKKKKKREKEKQQEVFHPIIESNPNQ